MKTFQQWVEALNTNVNTPMYVGQNTTDFDKPNILWITGMNSDGEGPKTFANLGFPIKHVSTDVNWPTTIMGRISRYPVLKQTIGGKAGRMGDSHMSDQVQKLHSELPLNWEPEIIVGTSQGGAVAMAAAGLFPKAKFILSAPAWKIFNVKPSIPADTIILQGKRDRQVPASDSQELANATGAKLVLTQDGHTIPYYAVARAIETQAKRIGKPLEKPEKLKPGPTQYILAGDKWLTRKIGDDSLEKFRAKLNHMSSMDRKALPDKDL